MSKSVHYRLPDELYEDLVEYAKKEGVSVTDVVIAGINKVLHEEQVGWHEDEPRAVVLNPEAVCVVEASPPAIKKVKDIPKVLPVLEKAIEKKVSSGTFRPYPKEYQTRNAGKKKS